MVTRENLADLGELVRVERKARGLTQQQLAERAGIRPSYLSNIERAYVHPRRGIVIPSDEALAGIADAIGISVVKLHAFLGRFQTSDPLSEKIKRLTEEQRRALHTIVDSMVPGDIDRTGNL